MSSLGVKGRTRSGEAHERDQQFGENESIDIGKSQSLPNEGNARINKVSAMRPGLANIIEKVHISRYFESPETDLHIAMNACSMDCADTWSSKQLHWLPKSPTPHPSTTYCGCEDTLKLDTGVAWVSLPIKFTHKWLQNRKYCDYRPLFTTQNEWTIVKDVMDVSRLFWCWTLWMSKRHTVTLHHVFTVYNDMFGHMDGVMRALAKKKTGWKVDLFFAVKVAWQKLFKYYAEVTPSTGMLLISAHILDSFRKLRLFRKWENGMDLNPEDETSYTT